MRSNKLKALPLLFLALIAFASPAMAVQPDEVLAEPALEARARDLGQILRCVVCQNQSIDDSNAPLARDLRILLRERLQAGDTDDEAMDYIVARYGHFVLLKPPMQLSTLLLWFGPALIFLLAAFAYWTMIRSKTATATASSPDTLSDEERDELRNILNKGQTS
jgi:cytochrome c-type biogenesis protein CcmH